LLREQSIAGCLLVVGVNLEIEIPSDSETRRAVRSSLVAKHIRTWQLSRIALFWPYAFSIWLSDCAIRKA
jgi:hypothetical protein